MIEIIDGVTLFPNLQTILAVDSSSIFDEEDMHPVEIGAHKIAPWGTDNNLPGEILGKVKKSDVISANLRFNRDVCYGLSPKLVKVLRDENGKISDYVEIEDGPEYEFFELNDFPLFYLEQITDMVYFHNAFAELIPSSSSNNIASIRHKEAAFSRWSTMNNKGKIAKHYYSGKWNNSPGISDIVVSKAIDEFNAVGDIKAIMALKKERMIYPIYLPSPGRPYYSMPEWYSIFQSGWYDHSVAIPELKKAIMKNNLGVKFIIYISQKYFDDIFQKEGIDRSDFKAIKKRVEEEKTKFNDFLTGSVNANKSILALKDYVMSGSSALENKWIEIEPIDNKFEGGEYITDIETAANIMCYAMGVHPNLIGATPGKSSGSLSGTDKRELFLMKQALMKPIVDRSLRIVKIIKTVNNWNKDITVVVPEYIFTTLDKAKSGKQESNNNKA
jgi:hypothetical protein